MRGGRQIQFAPCGFSRAPVGQNASSLPGSGAKKLDELIAPRQSGPNAKYLNNDPASRPQSRSMLQMWQQEAWVEGESKSRGPGLLVTHDHANDGFRT